MIVRYHPKVLKWYWNIMIFLSKSAKSSPDGEQKAHGTVAMQLVHCAQETMISLFWYLFLSMKAVVFFHDWISLNSIPVKSKSEEWKLCWHELFWIGSKNYISTLRIKRRNLVHLHKYSIKKDWGQFLFITFNQMENGMMTLILRLAI